MKNTLTDLNNYLFEQLERLNDDEISEEQLERELRKADSIVKVADVRSADQKHISRSERCECE